MSVTCHIVSRVLALQHGFNYGIRRYLAPTSNGDGTPTFARKIEVADTIHDILSESAVRRP